MPELPDIVVYIESLDQRVRGKTLQKVRLFNPFLLRSVEPPIRETEGNKVLELRRLGKRIVFALEDELFLVLHLMIAGRLHWNAPKGKTLATLTFDSGTLSLTEAGSQHRASMHMARGEEGLWAFDQGGIEVLESTPVEFAAMLTSANHTLKRALTDPRLFSGIGNAYSDEILHRARLSPVTLTQKLAREEVDRLHRAVQETLLFWIDRLRQETGDAFPENVTAFRPEMAVHGKFGQPCPVCGAKVQRIRYADNETNYCPGCQTRGRLLADRSLSLLLKKDWPKTPEELEDLRNADPIVRLSPRTRARTTGR